MAFGNRTQSLLPVAEAKQQRQKLNLKTFFRDLAIWEDSSYSSALSVISFLEADHLGRGYKGVQSLQSGLPSLVRWLVLFLRSTVSSPPLCVYGCLAHDYNLLNASWVPVCLMSQSKANLEWSHSSSMHMLGYLQCAHACAFPGPNQCVRAIRNMSDFYLLLMYSTVGPLGFIFSFPTFSLVWSKCLLI